MQPSDKISHLMRPDSFNRKKTGTIIASGDKQHPCPSTAVLLGAATGVRHDMSTPYRKVSPFGRMDGTGVGLAASAAR